MIQYILERDANKQTIVDFINKKYDTNYDLEFILANSDIKTLSNDGHNAIIYQYHFIYCDENYNEQSVYYLIAQGKKFGTMFVLPYVI